MTRSWTRLVTGSLLLAVGIAWLLDSAGLIDLTFRAVVAVALVVVGVSLVVGSRRGSFPALIAVGGVMALILVASSDAETKYRYGGESLGARRGGGRVYYTPTDPDRLRPLRRSAGDVHIDLRRLELTRSTTRVNARVGAGQIRIVVPRGVPVRVEARTGAGSIEVFGERRANGLTIRDTYESPDYDDERPRISIEARASAGSITVQRGTR